MSDETRKDPRVVLAEDRTGMASFRTSLALDRTTLAWIRTTLTMTSFGLAMIGFFRTLRMQNETPQTVRLHEGAIQDAEIKAEPAFGIGETAVLPVSFADAFHHH